jgi:hypothetical protein
MLSIANGNRFLTLNSGIRNDKKSYIINEYSYESALISQENLQGLQDYPQRRQGLRALQEPEAQTEARIGKNFRFSIFELNFKSIILSQLVKQYKSQR